MLSRRLSFSAYILFFCVLLFGCASEIVSSQKNATSPSKPTFVKLDETIHDRDQSFTTDTDLWAALRDGFQLPQMNTAAVKQQARLLASSPQNLQLTLEISSRYMHFILEETKARNMPSEMALVPFIESGFNPKTTKGMQPAGLWGLMPIAGKHLNLTQNYFWDERRDIILSSKAALDLLQTFYVQFGDWRLALAAYNWGPYNVARVVDKSKSSGSPPDFSKLPLPGSINAYVTKLMAWREIFAYPQEYHVDLPKLAYRPYFVEVAVARELDIKVAAQLAQVSLDEFLYLNPSFNKPLILGAGNHKILLPYTQKETFLENYKSYDQRFASWNTVVTRNSESSEILAQNFNADLHHFFQANGISQGVKIKAGTTVLVPKEENQVPNLSNQVAMQSAQNADGSYSGPRR